jgi:hypothetical protein
MFLERYDPLKQEMVCILAPGGLLQGNTAASPGQAAGLPDVPPDVAAAPLRPQSRLPATAGALRTMRALAAEHRLSPPRLRITPGLTDDTFTATFEVCVHIVHKEAYHDASTR